MSSVPKNSNISLKRKPRKGRRRRSKVISRRRVHAGACRAQERIGSGGTSSKVSDKLVALKNLIPTHNGEVVKDENLFQETAGYIVHLKAQVLILQSLIDFYGSGERQANAVL